MSATPIAISVGDSRTATKWEPRVLDWVSFTGSLQVKMKANCGRITHAEYMALPKSKQADLKDVGGFVGGTLRNGSRKRGCCTGRSLITLDMDNCEPGSTAKWVQAIKDMGTAAVYSTRKHDPEPASAGHLPHRPRDAAGGVPALRPDAGPDAGPHHEGV